MSTRFSTFRLTDILKMSVDSTVVTLFISCRADLPVVHPPTTEEALPFFLVGRGKGQLTP